ncbi:short chain dehydrogenase [Xylariales sp. PMI_506]|nr:short chain dehydrogenase [Xylariales sp. PMI_506]
MNLTNLFTVIGQGVVLVFAYRIGQFIWLHFLRPSSLPRYLKVPSGTAAYALVTGSSDGIGLTTATELLRRGFDVILHGRNELKLEGLVASLKQRFPERDVRQVTADATQVEQATSRIAAFVRSLRDETDAPNGKPMLKLVVNNIGANIFAPPYSRLDEMEAVHVRDTIGVNAVFPTQLTRELLPVLYEDAPGCVLSIGTVAPLGIGQPYVCPYGSSKAYNREFSSTLGQEMKVLGRDLEVITVGVGDIPTNSNKQSSHNAMTVSAEQIARDILDKVGSGSDFVPANWRQHAGVALAMLLPTSLAKSAMVVEMERRRSLSSKMS